MIEKFDAFISYKHAELDNRIAELIQNGLERYHIPKKIQEKTGKKKIERVFRDKTELPITSSLSDNISYALEHSDFLIVICSHSTKLSGWVPREIEYFLKFHSMDHVLTVLAEGEPAEVIPKQLLSSRVVKLDDNGDPVLNEAGESVVEEIPMEPLSCDYRLPLKRAKREELPRLAAVLVGCSYDELVMRARAYRRRRLTIFLSIASVLAAGAIAYLLWSRAQIQKNYEISQANLRQAQINQSEYLANASRTIYTQEHDGVGAVQLAIAALPTDGEERPVIPEAVYSLTSAIHAFTPDDVKSVIRYPDKKYSMGSFISQMAVNDDKSVLFLLDDSGRLGVFDILSQELLYEHEFEDAFTQRMSLTPYKEDYVLVSDGFRLYLLNWKSGETVWEKYLWLDDNGEKYTLKGVNTTKYSFAESYGYVWKDAYPEVIISLSPDGSLLAIEGGNDRIRLLDPNTGEEKTRISSGAETLEGYYENAIQKIVWSEDGTRLAAILMKGEYLSYTVSVLVYDTVSGKTEVLDTDHEYWDDICFAGKDKLLLLCSPYILDASYKQYRDYGKDSLLTASSCYAVCFSLQNNEILWETELPFMSPWEREGICAYASKADFGTESAIFTVSDMAYALKLSDGSISISQQFTDTLISIESISSNSVLFLLQDGEAAMIFNSDDGSDYAYQAPQIVDTGSPIRLQKIIRVPDSRKNARFLVSQENTNYVIGYSVVRDEDGQVLHSCAFQKYKDVRILNGRLLVTTDQKFYVVDIATDTLIAEVELGEISSSSVLYTPPGQDGSVDTVSLLIYSENGYECICVNLQDGSTDRMLIDKAYKAERNGYLYALSDEDGFGAVVRFSLADQTEERIELKGPEGEHINANGALFLSVDGSRMVAATQNNSFCMIHLEDGSVEILKTEAENANYFIWSVADNSYALVSNTTIKIFDENDQLKTEIPTRGQNYIFAHLDSERLYIAYDNANLFCYDASDGTELGTVTISIYTNDASSAEFRFTEDTLYVKAGKNNGRLSAIELESMTRRTLVEDCIGYCQETDEFLVISKCSDDQYRIYKFSNYSVEELIAKGKAFIGGNTISSEMAAKYGLES